MKLLSFSVVAALAFEHASASKMEAEMESQATFSTPYNLAGLEASLLGMYSQGKVAPGLEPFLNQIVNLTAAMKDQLIKQKDETQEALNKSWVDLKSCSFDGLAQQMPNSSVDTYDKAHRACAEKESEAYGEWQDCMSMLVPLNTTLQITFQEHSLYEDNWPYNCKISEPAPKGSTKPKMLEWVKFFEEKWGKWNVTYVKWQQALSAFSVKEAACTKLHDAWEAEFTKCTAIQNRMEAVACGGQTKECTKYKTCYKTTSDAYATQKDLAKKEASSVHAEWAAILRIECILKAFGKDLNDQTTLAADIAVCQRIGAAPANATNATPPVEFKEVAVTFYPTAQDPMPTLVECSISDAKAKPGTTAWTEEYCKGLPENTACENCVAECCPQAPLASEEAQDEAIDNAAEKLVEETNGTSAVQV
eukprot:TRINITY_DN78834_c0_g1_i1.p1 TRINITY_DN78834_c0_g1~~TRINITY_DN78834_c0_g1_i1.p1  ORF type:complete len:420 (+),score=120.22 TRINITY_DN78834_c0_g1_i1:92-1351(+)